MTTTRTADMRALVTAGQKAVLAVERHGAPETLAALDRALCELPLGDMDDQAHRIFNRAHQTVILAEDAETWAPFDAMVNAVSVWLHYPDRDDLRDAALMAVAELAVHCSSGRREAGSVEEAAWNRAHLAGVEALRAVAGALNGYVDRRHLDKAVVEFLDAVRRAVPYAALYEARRALVEFARTHGLFIVGMRQPTQDDWEWMRRIGSAVYLFRVDPPGVDHYGSVTVQRVAEDGTTGAVRTFALTARPASIAEARNRI